YRTSSSALTGCCLFNTALSGTTDTGYSLQFDRGYSTNSVTGNNGAIIIRPRTAGAEASPGPNVWTYANTGGLIHHKQTDPAWWAAPHTLTLKVSSTSPTGRNLTFSIDGQMIFNNFNFTAPADSSTSYTGLRANATPTKFGALTVG
ncbi:MAG: hypothetical protein WCI74_20675, partial [Actinomycetes bacterium]